jgi:hypothetical protein
VVPLDEEAGDVAPGAELRSGSVATVPGLGPGGTPGLKQFGLLGLVTQPMRSELPPLVLEPSAVVELKADTLHAFRPWDETTHSIVPGQPLPEPFTRGPTYAFTAQNDAWTSTRPDYISVRGVAHTHTPACPSGISCPCSAFTRTNVNTHARTHPAPAGPRCRVSAVVARLVAAASRSLRRLRRLSAALRSWALQASFFSPCVVYVMLVSVGRVPQWVRDGFSRVPESRGGALALKWRYAPHILVSSGSYISHHVTCAHPELWGAHWPVALVAQAHLHGKVRGGGRE